MWCPLPTVHFKEAKTPFGIHLLFDYMLPLQLKWAGPL